MHHRHNVGENLQLSNNLRGCFSMMVYLAEGVTGNNFRMKASPALVCWVESLGYCAIWRSIGNEQEDSSLKGRGSQHRNLEEVKYGKCLAGLCHVGRETFGRVSEDFPRDSRNDGEFPSSHPAFGPSSATDCVHKLLLLSIPQFLLLEKEEMGPPLSATSGLPK